VRFARSADSSDQKIGKEARALAYVLIAEDVAKREVDAGEMENEGGTREREREKEREKGKYDERKWKREIVDATEAGERAR